METEWIVRIIVHPEGLLDIAGAGYWTEVVEMPRCMTEGRSETDAIESTKRNIRAAIGSEQPAIVIEEAL